MTAQRQELLDLIDRMPEDKIPYLLRIVKTIVDILRDAGGDKY